MFAIPILICGLALAAGCSKTADPAVPTANGSGSASPGAASGGYGAFFGCLRQHGISVPDSAPSSPGAVGEWMRQQKEQNPAEYRAAARACQNQMPPTGPGTTLPTAQELEQDRAFAVCMRAHGIQVSDPDRTGDMQTGGRLAHATRAQELNDPGYKAANQACKAKLPAEKHHK